MVKLVERTLSPADIKALFAALADVRGAGGKGLATQGKELKDKAKSKWDAFKQRLTNSEEPDDDLQRLQELAGVVSEASPAFITRMKQQMQDQKAKITQQADSAKDAWKRNTQDKGIVDVFDIVDAWKAAGQPNDFDEIVDVLKSLSFTGNEIKNAMIKARISDEGDSDPKVTNLARAIKQEKLDKDVLQYLEKMGITESLNEKILDDAGIKQIFMGVIDVAKAAAQNEPRDLDYTDEINKGKRKMGVDQNADQEPPQGDENLQDDIDFQKLLSAFADVSVILETAKYGRRKKNAL